MSWTSRLYRRHVRWRLSGFARVLFWADKFEQRFTLLGRWLVAAIFLCLMMGANITQSNIYQLFSVLLAVCLVALVWVGLGSLRRKKKFKVRRQLPKLAQVGVPCCFSIQIQNVSDAVQVQLRVSERLTSQFPTLDQFIHMREPGEEQRNWYDRTTGFYRFVWLTRWLSGGEVTSNTLDSIQAQATQHVPMMWQPLHRGRVVFSTIRLAIHDPLGIAYIIEQHHIPQAVLVLPKVYTVPSDWISAGMHDDLRAGMDVAEVTGDSAAFHCMREYRAGDSPRHIHWVSLAKREQPLVKEFEHESVVHPTLILDNVAGEQYSLLFEEAVSVAAGCVDGLHSSGYSIDFWLSSAQAQHHSLSSTYGVANHNMHLIELLATVELRYDVEFSLFIKRMEAQINQLGACVLITVQWDNARQNWVEHLRRQDINVRVLVVVEHSLDIAQQISHDVCWLRAGCVEQDLARSYM